ALNEWDPAGAQDVHYQGLRQQRFEKPSGVEHRLVRSKDIPEDSEGQVVEQGTERPQYQHAAADIPEIPAARLLQVGSVDLVAGQRGLRHVVQQIIEQDLQRCHGQERQHQAGAQYAEHIAHIRAGAHAQVFADIAKYAAALDHAILQYHQAFFEQDDVGRFLGDIDRIGDRNADVC